MKRLVLGLALITLAMVGLSYYFFWFSEEVLIKNALKELQGESYKIDVYQLTRSIHRAVCDKERLSYCSVEFIDPAHKLAFSVPERSINETIEPTLFKKTSSIGLSQFTEAVSLKIVQSPSLKHFILLFLFSAGAISPFVLYILYSYKKRQLYESELLNRITKQVSHDIRSPLLTLKMAMEDIKSLPHDKLGPIHSAIDRINDIANNVLQTDRAKIQKIPTKVELIAPLVENIVSEKSLEYSAFKKIEIRSDLTNSYGLFANVNSVELKRVFSNLINNSVEAICDEGIILVKVSAVENEVIISIEDNGKGIPEEILKKIGEEGVSYGKKINGSGSGLGLYHAKATISQFGGRIDIQSKFGVGTLISIYLPKVSVPQWFAKELILKNVDFIYVLDNDSTVHEQWAKLLPNRAQSFKEEEKFITSLNNNVEKNFICLIDHDWTGPSGNGFELIKSLGLLNNSFVMTNSLQDEIISKALEHNIKLVPKMFSSLISISDDGLSAPSIYDYVYIEDDVILRNGWERRAKKRNIRLLLLSSPSELKHYSSLISKENTQIYIDSFFGENIIRGEDFAVELFESGYRNLFMASGYDKEKFAHLPWLKCIGKECPF